MNDDFFMSWHPFIELGKIVRDHYRHVIFSIGCQKMVQSQCGTYSIPVRGNMCHYYKTFAFLDVLLGFLSFLFVNDFRNHIFSYFQ